MGYIDRIFTRLSGLPVQHAHADAPSEPKPVVATPLPSPPQPVKIANRTIRANPASYLSNIHTPLVRLSPKDRLTIEDFFAGVHVTGGNGSGKTSGSGQTMAKAFLRGGFGGLVLCAKPDERANWERYAKECGRQNHLIIVSEDSPWRFNVIQYELKRHGDTTTKVQNLVTILMNLAEQTGRRTNGEDQFWQQAAEQLLRNVLMVLAAARSEFSLLDVQRFIHGIPTRLEETEGEKWNHSDTAAYLQDAKIAYEAAGRLSDYDALHHYFTRLFPTLADRTRSSVTFTLSAMLQELLVGTPRELFATSTNFFPEDTFESAIIVIDLPAVLSRSNATAQTLFKLAWQTAALRRMELIDSKTRPVFLWMDEAHFFVTEHDNRFQSLARAARVCTVCMTQNISAYRASLSASNSADMTNWLMGLFQTHIFHAQSDPTTIEHAQKLFGKRLIARMSYNQTETWGDTYSHGYNNSQGYSGNGEQFQASSSDGTNQTYGDNQSQTIGHTENTAMDFALEASDFTRLATGTDDVSRDQRRLKGIAQAFVFRTGKTWSSGETFLLAQFSRRLP